VRLTRLKVGDGPNSRVPPVSGRSKKKKGEGGVGPAVARSWATGLACSRGKGKRKWPAGLKACGLKEEKGRERERERWRGKGFCLFFKISFKFIFQTFKLQSNKIHAFES
jgi:hypothetical protein